MTTMREALINILLLSVVVVAASHTYATLTQGREPAERRPKPTVPKDRLDTSGAPYAGSPDARVVLIEFGDLECPYCGRFAREAKPVLMERYVSRGLLRIVFVNLPLPAHRFAAPAAEAALCAHDTGQFWSFHDRLLLGSQVPEPGVLRRIAEELDLGLPFKECVDNRQMLEAVERDMLLATKLGVASTPSFLLGVAREDHLVQGLEWIVGAKPVAVFADAIEGLLEVDSER